MCVPVHSWTFEHLNDSFLLSRSRHFALFVHGCLPFKTASNFILFSLFHDTFQFMPEIRLTFAWTAPGNCSKFKIRIFTRSEKSKLIVSDAMGSNFSSVKLYSWTTIIYCHPFTHAFNRRHEISFYIENSTKKKKEISILNSNLACKTFSFTYSHYRRAIAARVK